VSVEYRSGYGIDGIVGRVEAMRAWAMAGMILLAAGCAGGGGGIEGEWEYRRTVQGNTTTVRTLSGSLWGGEARLVEEASIGDPGRGDAYLLAHVQAIECDRERIYILDQQIPIIHVYDMQGEHLWDIGREGEGPGEYLRPRSLAINPADGNLYVRDGRGARIPYFTPQGEYVGQWRLFGGWSMGSPMFFADDGTLYTPAIINAGPNTEVWDWRGGRIAWGPEGALGDTLAEPEVDFQQWQLVAQDPGGDGTSVNNVPFSPGTHWTYSRDRKIIGGVSEEYRFEVRWPDGRVFIVERDYDPVPVAPEEALWHERAETANMRGTQPGWAWNGKQIPAHKPPFDFFTADRSGRIWVQRVGPGRRVEGGVEDPLANSNLDWYRNPLWVDTWRADVFTCEGEFLGEVDLPTGFSFTPEPYIEGDMVIAYFEDDEGLPHITKYRLVLPDYSPQ